MKTYMFAAICSASALLLFAGCTDNDISSPSQRTVAPSEPVVTTPPVTATPIAPEPVPNRPGVDVQAPGVDVKAGGGRVEVRAPGADIEVERKREERPR